MSLLMTILLVLMHLVFLMISTALLACTVISIILLLRFSHVISTRLLKKKDWQEDDQL